MVVSIVFIIIIGGTLAFMLMQWRRSKSGGGGFGSPAAGTGEQGTLTVTGVSGRGAPDKNGQSFFTISGTIIGPGTQPTEVYGDLVLADGQPEPKMGDDLPVVYTPGKAATSWRFGTLAPPPPPPGTPPPPPGSSPLGG